MDDACPFLFSSEYLDSETNLVYYNYRYYSPGLGRWTKRDPIEEDGGWNLYGVLGNDVLSKIDTYGLTAAGCCSDSPAGKFKCCKNWEEAWVIGGFSDPYECANSIIDGTWWGSPMGEFGVGIMGMTGDALLKTSTTVPASTTYALPVTATILVGWVFSYRIALKTCLAWHCTSSYRPDDCKCVKAGWIWDTWECKCKEGDMILDLDDNGIRITMGFRSAPPPTGSNSDTKWQLRHDWQ